MGRVKIPYYIIKRGRGFWNPSAAMKRAGFASIPCGLDGPEAWALADTWNKRWLAYRRGTVAPARWPERSLGEAFDLFRATETWKRKAVKTRQEWEAMARLYIMPFFGDYPPTVVTLDRLDKWYALILPDKSIREAHRAMKIWRALWRGAMGYCTASADPSLGIRRKTPTPQSAVW
jgi:hypothetical protein